MTRTDSNDVIEFWFKELGPADWFKKSEALDNTILQRFSEVYKRAAAGELFEWRTTPQGRLAEIIVLDQFPRNMFRNSSLAFASDVLALILCQECMAVKADLELSEVERGVLYMPLMHSESKRVHTVALAVFEKLGAAGSLQAEKKHKAIVDRFGRYPHRNAAMGRSSTTAEVAFLQEPGSSF